MNEYSLAKVQLESLSPSITLILPDEGSTMTYLSPFLYPIIRISCNPLLLLIVAITGYPASRGARHAVT